MYVLQSPTTILWQWDPIDTDACALLYVLVCSIMNLILSSNLISRYYSCCWCSLWLWGKRTSRRQTTVYALAERKAYRTSHPTASPPARPLCLISCNNACIAAPKTNHYIRVHISPQSCHTFALNSSHYWTCSPRDGNEQAQYVCFGFGNPPQHRRQRKSYRLHQTYILCIDVLYIAVKQRLALLASRDFVAQRIRVADVNTAHYWRSCSYERHMKNKYTNWESVCYSSVWVWAGIVSKYEL